MVEEKYMRHTQHELRIAVATQRLWEHKAPKAHDDEKKQTKRIENE